MTQRTIEAALPAMKLSKQSKAFANRPLRRRGQSLIFSPQLHLLVFLDSKKPTNLFVSWVRERSFSLANPFYPRYNKGIQNDLTLTVKNTKDASKGIKDAPDCEHRFTALVIDACDGNDPSNTFNYKWGATYTTTDNWQYTMDVAPNTADADNCDVSYKLADDFFEIRGKNFPPSLGAHGAGLKKQLDGCGGSSSITNWHFETTPEDTVYQWYARGNTLVGQKNCIGHAVVTAGGSSTGNCHGAG